jgi:hypothetical protein
MAPAQKCGLLAIWREALAGSPSALGSRSQGQQRQRKLGQKHTFLKLNRLMLRRVIGIGYGYRMKDLGCMLQTRHWALVARHSKVFLCSLNFQKPRVIIPLTVLNPTPRKSTPFHSVN